MIKKSIVAVLGVVTCISLVFVVRCLWKLRGVQEVSATNILIMLKTDAMLFYLEQTNELWAASLTKTNAYENYRFLVRSAARQVLALSLDNHDQLESAGLLHESEKQDKFDAAIQRIRRRRVPAEGFYAQPAAGVRP